MCARDYRAKFGAYHEYLATGRYERDYDGGFPTILVVTGDNAAEERIALAVRTAGLGRGATLPLLLTCRWRVDDPRNPGGLLGPIWRAPEAGFRDRRVWPVEAAGGTGRLGPATARRGLHP